VKVFEPVTETEIEAELETVEVEEGVSEIERLKERLWEIDGVKETDADAVVTCD